jgi:predicted DNA-binding ribbon-helix-helix protein
MSSNEPNPIEFAAHCVSRTGTMTYHGKLHQISVRLQTPNFLTLQAMAETSGLTRSDMVNRVLEAGIYAIREQLSDKACDNLNAAIQRVSAEFLEEVQQESKS